MPMARRNLYKIDNIRAAAPVLIPVDEALARLFALAPDLAIEQAPLREAAGRWAAADVRARRTQPAATLSAMDGYAIRFADLPGPWTRVGESAAGRPFAGEVGPGGCVRIFTGAALPAGTDTVLVQEEARVEGAAVHLSGDGPERTGRNTRPRGLDFGAGDLLVAAGERFTPARVALAATGGHGTLSVRARVRVALVATGDELVPPGGPVEGLALPESNTAMLAAMLAGLPVEVVDLGILPDRLHALRDAFAETRADILVTTGGASVGDHDLVRPALEAAGAVIDFWRIALRPGKPMMAGRLGELAVLGLPGNPVSVYVTAFLFLLPLVRRMAGASQVLPRTSVAVLGDALPANGGRRDYLRAWRRDGQVWTARVQDSSMLRALADADCLVVREPLAPAAAVGDSAEILDIA
jgi:molybdopterin molybdotransferase